MNIPREKTFGAVTGIPPKIRSRNPFPSAPEAMHHYGEVSLKSPSTQLTVFTKLALCVAVVFGVPRVVCGQRQVAVDQAGYTSSIPKYVFSAQPADSFVVVSITGRTPVFRGAMTLWATWDDATGRAVYRGDFTSLQVPGLYQIVTSRGDSSAEFGVSDSAYNQVFRKSLKGFYFQRCGTALLSMNAGPYVHGICHLTDGLFHATSDSAGRFHLATGGWHDAGDYGKYVVNAGISTGTLLLAWEMFPSRFEADDLGIPESGNGVPDILDEARYEIEWFLKMQRADGAFWFKVTPAQFEGFIMPQLDNSSRYIYQVSSTATGDAVAVLGRAARLYAPFDTAFSRKCLNAAKRGWQFLYNNPQIIPPGGFKNPAGTNTGEYGDGDDSDERLWAAAELFESTGDSLCNMYVISQYAFGPVFTGAMAWPEVSPLALLTYLRSTRSNADATVKAELRTALLNYCAAQVAKRNASGYQVVLARGGYFWGSNSDALNAAILLIAGYAESGNESLAAAAADQLHYVLGVNGFARSYITGIGENPPMQPHHRPSASDGVAAPVPGLLAGGPNEYGGDPVLQVLINASTPAALCYKDTVASYASNEICINWNAPLVFVAGYFNNASGSNTIGDARSDLPSGFSLAQNYPNPFNSATQIEYTIPDAQRVRVRVFDLLGKEVRTLVDEEQQRGTHRVSWDASGLASGVYVYALICKQRAVARRLVLLK